MERPRLYYDSDCAFCRWALGWVLRWDRSARLRPVEIDSREGERELGDLGAARFDSWHLVRDGERHSGRRWIAHVDMDAFFVGAELLRRPELRGRPVVVATGTDPQARGVVMAASYEARAHGVHSALPLAVAHRRCPQAVLIPRDMGYYRELSERVMGMLGRYSDRVEVAGL